MIVVVAGRFDRVAADLVLDWAAHGAAILGPEDVSRRGWRHDVHTPDDGVAVVEGQPIAVSAIDAVIVRRPAIFEHELLGIVPADRQYVAAEATAFLIAWLASRKCPVFNRATATSLSGPNFRPEQWVRLAWTIGIPASAVARHVPAQEAVAQAPRRVPVAVTVVDDRCLGEVDASLHEAARCLARASGMTLCDFLFDGPDGDAKFLTANPWPDLSRAEVREALLESVDRHRVHRKALAWV